MSAQPARSQAPDRLKPAIERLETSLVMPIVSGELTTWTANVQQAFAETIAAWQARRPAEDQNLREIGEQDPELLYKVEQLKAEREEAWRHAQEVSEMLGGIEQRAQAVEPDERRVEKLLSDTVARALDFVIRLRRLDAELTTWLFEAFQRDRGVGD